MTSSFVSQVAPLFGNAIIEDSINDNDSNNLLKIHSLLKFANQDASQLYARLMSEHSSLQSDQEQLLSLLLLDALIGANHFSFDDFLSVICSSYLKSMNAENGSYARATQRYVCVLVAKYVKTDVNNQASQNILNLVEQRIANSITSDIQQDSELLDSVLVLIDLVTCLVETPVASLAEYEEKWFQLFARGLVVWPSIHRKQVIMNVLPSMIKTNPSSQRLSTLWQTVQVMFDADRETRIESYSLLCQFYEQYFAIDQNNNKYMLDLRGEEKFWIMILSGLSDEDTFTGRRSIYLLKRIVDTSKSNPQLRPEKWTRYFIWGTENDKELSKQWDLFFMLYDTLDQYAAHLLQSTWGQIFNMIPKRGASKGVYLDFAWIKLLLVSAFTHNNFGVCKKTLASFFEIDLSVYEIFFDISFVTETILDFINNSKIFILKENIGERMIKFFQCFFNMLSHDELVVAVKQILRSLSLKAASRLIPAYFLASMRHIKSNNVLDNDCVDYLTTIYEDHYAEETAWVQFRGSSLVLEILSNLSDSAKLSQSTISRFLSVVDKQVFTQKVSTTVTSWLAIRGEDVLIQDLSELLAESMMKETAKLTSDYILRFCRLLSLAPLNVEQVQAILQPIYQKLSNIYTHYQEETTPDKVALFISVLLAEMQNNAAIQAIHGRVFQDIEELTSFMMLKLSFPEFNKLSRDIAFAFQDRINILGPLTTLLNQHFTDSEYVRKLNAFIIQKTTEFYTNVLKQKRDLQQNGYEVNVLSTCASDMIHSLLVPRLNSKHNAISVDQYLPLLRSVFSSHVFTSRVRSDDEVSSVNASERPASMILKDAFESKWRNINEIVHIMTYEKLLDDEQDLHLELLSEAVDVIETLSSNNMIIAVDCVRYLLPLALEKDLIDEEKAEQYLSCVFSALQGDRHRNEAICYASFTNCIMKPAVLKKAGAVSKHFIDKLLELGEAAQRLVFSLAYELSNILIGDDEALKIDLVEQVVKVLCFVPTNYEEDDYESFEFASESTDYTQSQGSYPASIRFERLVRALIFTSFTKLQNHTRFVEAFSGRLIQRLFDTDMNRIPCMPNSTYHKLKLRIWQSLILLSQYVTKDMFNTLNLRNVTWDLLNLANMSTVRRLMEIYSILICFKFPSEMVESLKQRLGADYNARAQYLSSLVAVAGNFILYAKDEDFMPLVKTLLPYIIMYSTMHQYAVRIMGHIMYVQIWTRINSLPNRSEIKGLAEDDMWKIQLDRLQDFYTKSESCIQYFEKYRDMVMIKITEIAKPINLFGQPYVEGTNVVNDHVPPSAFNLVHNHMHEFFCSLFNLNGKMLDTWTFRVDSMLEAPGCTYSWQPLFKTADGDYSAAMASLNPLKGVEVTNFEIDARDLPEPFKVVQQQMLDMQNAPLTDREDGVMNFQRKIVPWTALELESEINPRLKRASKERQPVIVMASLIDKLPNLAGLSRTCEIFQAEKLVINNTKVTQMDEFKGISVTSERWLPIEECKEEDIASYLKQKKLEGYEIVGVEQTSSSISIDQFTFPKKCVLVLGKEKEGIPTELINMIDTCVEIPQLGMIRSLNVHVTGSIMMYEYTRQKQIAKK